MLLNASPPPRLLFSGHGALGIRQTGVLQILSVESGDSVTTAPTNGIRVRHSLTCGVCPTSRQSPPQAPGIQLLCFFPFENFFIPCTGDWIQGGLYVSLALPIFDFKTVSELSVLALNLLSSGFSLLSSWATTPAFLWFPSPQSSRFHELPMEALVLLSGFFHSNFSWDFPFKLLLWYLSAARSFFFLCSTNLLIV